MSSEHVPRSALVQRNLIRARDFRAAYLRARISDMRKFLRVSKSVTQRGWDVS